MDIDKRVELFEHRFREYLDASITYAELQEPYQPLSSEDEIAWLKKELRQTITQVITNTGEELMRLVDEDEPYGGAKEIVKKHITKVTGVE